MAPRQIGVTGGIGSGKSVVCRIFMALGVPVYDADTRAKWLTTHDPALQSSILALLGPDAYLTTPEGQRIYNRAWVASQVFTNPERLIQLNALIHPRVLADTETWVQQHARFPYVVKEAALMRAAGDHNSLDNVVVVTAPVDLRIARIRQRDPFRSNDDIRHIIDRQVSDTERLQVADYVVQNDETHLVLPQVLQLHEVFLQKAGPV